MATPLNEAVQEEMRTPEGIRKALLNWYQAAGINPFANPYAARMLGRSGEVASLMDLYQVTDADRPGFITNWAQRGTTGQGGGQWDLSNQAMRGRIGQGEMFRTGDPTQDANTIREFNLIANRGMGDRWSQTLDRLDQQKSLQYGAWRQQNPNYSGYYADWYNGQPAQGGTFTPPAWSGGQGQAAPNPWQQPPPAAGGPPETPPGNQPGDVGIPPNYPDYSGHAPNTPPGGATAQAFQNWTQALDALMQGHDPRNRATSGFWPSMAGRGFTLGGVTFDPSQATQGGQWQFSSGARNYGSPAGMFDYRFRQLADQLAKEKAGGADYPAVPGYGTADENTIARLVVDWINQHYQGQSGFRYA